MRKKLVSIIALALCAAVVFSGGSQPLYATAQEQINEIEESSVTREESSTTPLEAVLKTVSQAMGSLFFGGTQSDAIGDEAEVRFPFIIVPFQESPGFLTDIKSWLWIGTEVYVLDYWGDYAYVECVETEEKGYIHTICLDDPDPTLKIKEYEHIYKGVTKTLTYDYNGSKEVKWSLSDSGIIKCTSVENGIRITGLKPGTVKLTVKAGSIEKTLNVHCVYQWKKPWTAVALTSTTVYKGPDESYGVRASLSKGTRFIVKGDDGDSDGWAYGQIYNTDTWGFVRIEDVSTKGTVSQYNKMGWTYPIKETKYKEISSPYGWRSSGRHLGFDINKGDFTSIVGVEAVATFDGTVVFANQSYDAAKKEPTYGYCVIIKAESEEGTTIRDPISGNCLYAVYMHFSQKPSVSVGDFVDAGATLGKIGSTGNTTGPHLHIEINNAAKNFVGKKNADSFDKTINPIFFYMDEGLADGSDSTFNEYWYNTDN